MVERDPLKEKLTQEIAEAVDRNAQAIDRLMDETQEAKTLEERLTRLVEDWENGASSETVMSQSLSLITEVIKKLEKMKEVKETPYPFITNLIAMKKSYALNLGECDKNIEKCQQQIETLKQQREQIKGALFATDQIHMEIIKEGEKDGRNER